MSRIEIRGDRRKAQMFGEWLVIWEVFEWEATCADHDDETKNCVARFYDAREAMSWTISKYGIIGTSIEACMIKAF